MADDLLLEIGTEELPASFVSGALDAMPGLARSLLADARIAHGDVRAIGTARRLTLLVDAVAAAQADLSEEITGPPRSVALGADGKPTKAGEGFAKKNGVDPSALYVVTTPKGEYVAVKKEARGQPAAEILPGVLATLASKIPFPKSMRWGAGEHSFGRPVHWIVALHGRDAVNVRFAGVDAGRSTRGHRFLAPAAFDLASPAEYVTRLRAAHVLVDPAERRSAMTDRLAARAAEIGAELVPDDFLVGECLHLVEEPHALPGRFDERYLDLPEPVIVSVMRNHQRYFAVRDPKTK
jgi:glycyl-tRNA synthetase beta chain